MPYLETSGTTITMLNAIPDNKTSTINRRAGAVKMESKNPKRIDAPTKPEPISKSSEEDTDVRKLDETNAPVMVRHTTDRKRHSLATDNRYDHYVFPANHWDGYGRATLGHAEGHINAAVRVVQYGTGRNLVGSLHHNLK